MRSLLYRTTSEQEENYIIILIAQQLQFARFYNAF